MDEPTTIGTAASEVIATLTPTRKQLRYLAYLAHKVGGSYAIPVTRQQASEEIERLLREPRARAQRRRKRKTRRTR